MRRFLKWVGIGFLSFVVLWLASGYIVTRLVTAPRHHPVGPRADIAGKPAQEVSVTTEDGLVLSAWYVPNDTPNAVITLSGIGNDRRMMVPTAETYIRWGCAALLPDLRGTGQSQGDLVSIGYYERKDLEACVRWLRDKGYKTVGAHGVSLGAATICFAFKDVPDLRFAVVESSFDTMKSATDNRLEMFHIPDFIDWPYRIYLSYRLGASFTTMSPIEYVSYCKCPALFLGGDDEVFLKVSETTALYNRCGSPKKQLHIFKGGHHRPSISAFPEESRNTIRQFLVNDVGLKLP